MLKRYLLALFCMAFIWLLFAQKEAASVTNVSIPTTGGFSPFYINNRKPLPQSPVTVSTKATSIELIPMGAARLRISDCTVIVNILSPIHV